MILFDNLKKEITTFYVIKVQDFENYFRECYGFFPDLIAKNEWNNYSSYSFLSIEKEVVSDREKDWTRFLDTKGEISIYPGILLHRMYRDGYIEKGNYLLSVYW